MTDDLVSRIASELIAAILAGDFRAGERLNEVHIARQMTTSRGPVREALRKLESQGLVVSRQRRGFFVREFTSGGLYEIYEARLCLELHSATIAVSRMTADNMAALWRHYEIIRAAATADDTQTQVMADFGFHLMIAEIAGNNYIHGLMRTLATETLAGIALVGNIARDPVYNAETHLPLLRAFEQGDVDTVRAALARHIESGRDEIIRFYEEKQLS